MRRVQGHNARGIGLGSLECKPPALTTRPSSLPLPHTSGTVQPRLKTASEVINTALCNVTTIQNQCFHPMPLEKYGPQQRSWITNITSGFLASLVISPLSAGSTHRSFRTSQETPVSWYRLQSCQDSSRGKYRLGSYHLLLSSAVAALPNSQSLNLCMNSGIP